jgi:hypothetical protein
MELEEGKLLFSLDSSINCINFCYLYLSWDAFSVKACLRQKSRYIAD